MNRLITLALLWYACISGVNAQLLYKISGNGLEQPSYIFGTHELGNVGFVNKISGLHDAFVATEQVYGETRWDDLNKPDSVSYRKAALTLPDGKRLKNVLPANTLQKLNRYLKTVMGADMNNSYVADKMGRMTPLGITKELYRLSFMTHHMGEFDPTNTFDLYFWAQAKRNNEDVGGFETVAQRVKTLYGSQSMKRQIALLNCFLNNISFYESNSEKIYNAYHAQDPAAIEAALGEKLGNGCDATAAEPATIPTARTAAWLAKMPAIMAAKPTFFVVSIDFMVGKNGLLEGLRRLGYTVDGVGVGE